MDFQNRSSQPQNSSQSQTSSQPQVVASSTRSSADFPSKIISEKTRFGRITNLSLFGAVVILLIALVTFIALGGNGDKEGKYVDSTKLQAVFLQTGQVYFGKLKINNGTYVLSNIYYLQTSSTGTGTAASSSVSLVKLGCELHQPYDQMVINHTQITFWENLQDGGQVGQAVAKFVKANPNGQKCTTPSATSTTSNVQNAGSVTN